MGSFTDSRLVFQAEWYDQNAELVRRYQFMFYPVDNTVEMFDVKNRWADYGLSITIWVKVTILCQLFRGMGFSVGCFIISVEYLFPQMLQWKQTLTSRRLFLKRSAVPNITEDKLYVGSVVNVNSRQLTLTGYGDNFTEKTLATRNEKTLAIIKPDAVGKVGPILERVCREGLLIFQNDCD